MNKKQTAAVAGISALAILGALNYNNKKKSEVKISTKQIELINNKFPEDILIVFVHGGLHNAKCWKPLEDEIHKINPAIPTLAVNLPGRGGEPGDLESLTINQCAESVVEKIDAYGDKQIVLVGHSMAGITVPKIAELLGSERLRQTIFLACCIPENNKNVIETIKFPMLQVARATSKKMKVVNKIPDAISLAVFANGMNAKQKKTVLGALDRESISVITENVHRNMPDKPKLWILTKKDRALSPRLQLEFINNLGGVDRIVEMDTCHNAMISEPETLAKIIMNEICE